MANTGAPYFIPYVEPSDLVRDYPAADEASADAIAAALDGIPVLAGIGSNVVQTVKTNTFTTSSNSFVDVTGLSVTITPTSSASKVLIVVQAGVNGNSATAYRVNLRFDRNGTAVAANFYGNSSIASTSISHASFAFLDSPASASAVTYKLQVAGNASQPVFIGRSALNSVAMLSQIMAIEVAA